MATITVKTVTNAERGKYSSLYGRVSRSYWSKNWKVDDALIQEIKELKKSEAA